MGSGDGDVRFRLWGGAGGTYYPWPGQFLFTGKATIENANCGWRAPDSTSKLHKQLEVVILQGKCKLEKLIQLSELGTDSPGMAFDLKITFCAFYETVKNTIINETLMYSALCLKVQENIELIVQITSLCTCHENRDRAWKS